MIPNTTAALAAAAVLWPAWGTAQELVLSVGTRGYGAVVPHALETFAEAHPGIEVEWLRTSDVPNELRQIYVTNLMGRSATPDVFAVDIIWAGEFAQRGWLEPLDDLIPEEERATYLESFAQAATIDGTLYAAPLYTDGIHLFYRSDLLEKHGLEPPETWEELIAHAQTVLEGEGNPQLYGFASMWAPIEGLFMNYLGFLGAAGGSFFDEEGALAIESEASVEALTTMVEMLHEERIAPDSILGARPDDARTLFQQGRAVFMMVQGFVWQALTAPDSPVAGDVAFTRVPYFEGHPDANTTPLGGWLLAINPHSENKEAAALLVRHMLSPEVQLWAALNADRAPGNTAVSDAPELQASEGALRGFVENYAVGVARPSAETGADYPRVSEIMQREITEALQRVDTPEEALADAAEQIRSVLGD